MIGILGAMQIEVDGLLKSIDIKSKKEAGGFVFFEGEYNGKGLVVCQCGIGKVAASVAAALMLSLFPQIDLVVNIGVAGGIYPSIKQGDVVVSKNTAQHDWKSPERDFGFVEGFDEVKLPCDERACDIMDKVLTEQKVKHYLATIVTGDQFINDYDKARWLHSEFNAYACDMESGAINHACYLLKKRFLAVRAISDNGDGSAVEDFYSFMEIAAKRSIAAILAFAMKWDIE